MRRLNLYQIAQGIPGISATVGNFFAEAAQICLEKHGYVSGVSLKL